MYHSATVSFSLFKVKMYKIARAVGDKDFFNDPYMRIII
jgi:hypothetical protein